MKKLIIIALAFIGLQATAQRNQGGPKNHDRGDKMMTLTPEEMATLQTKKMTLELDLDEGQQSKILKINLENAINRKAKMDERKANKESENTEKPSKEDRVKMMNDMLDHKIAEKAKMKKILNADQYEKWVKSQEKRDHKKRGGKKGDRKNKDHKKD